MPPRISIDTNGMTSPRGPAFKALKPKRSPYRFITRTRLLGAVCFFLFLYYYLAFGDSALLFPEDPYQPLADESLRDILNATLGFEKILVLNLPFRTDRRDAVTLSAAVSDMKLEFVDGVTGESIPEKAFPPPYENIKLPKGIQGSWRTHMNALQRVIRENLTSALIVEDDIDWDVRLRPQLQRFALASRFLAENKDDSLAASGYPVVKNQNPETDESLPNKLSRNPVQDELHSIPLTSTTEKTLRHSKFRRRELQSPYGDPAEWDVLWVGHCGTGFPRTSSARPTRSTTKNVLLTLFGDVTVPMPKWLKSHPFGPLDALSGAYAPHTRVYHRASGGTLCTIGYAVSQRGARRVLHQFGVKHWNGIYDLELGTWCAGSDDEGDGDNTTAKAGGPLERVCLTSQPPIFAHHHPEDGESDIGGLGGGYATKHETKYLRYSTRMNLEKLVRGAGEPLTDQWPDESD